MYGSHSARQQNSAIRLETSKLPWRVTVQRLANTGLVGDVIYHYISVTQTELQRLILILFEVTFQVKITHGMICLMQFPINSLTPQCINTPRHVLVTPNKK